MGKEEASVSMGCVKGKEGQWVVVRNDKVIACGDDAEDMFTLAEQYPEGEVVVTKILYDGASFY